MKLSKYFKTTQSDLKQHNNKTFKIIRELTQNEADIFDVGCMFKIKLSTGEIIDCFEDEIYEYEENEISNSIGI